MRLRWKADLTRLKKLINLTGWGSNVGRYYDNATTLLAPRCSTRSAAPLLSENGQFCKAPCERSAAFTSQDGHDLVKYFNEANAGGSHVASGILKVMWHPRKDQVFPGMMKSLKASTFSQVFHVFSGEGSQIFWGPETTEKGGHVLNGRGQINADINIDQNIARLN